MLTYLRYALATACFAASIGCLALWGWSINRKCIIVGSIPPSFYGGGVVINGFSAILFYRASGDHEWEFYVADVAPGSIVRETSELFRITEIGYHFPLWYPALIFALAGVASLRLGRRFTLRSAIIATTVVAALLGMAVVL